LFYRENNKNIFVVLLIKSDYESVFYGLLMSLSEDRVKLLHNHELLYFL